MIRLTGRFVEELPESVTAHRLSWALAIDNLVRSIEAERQAPS